MVWSHMTTTRQYLQKVYHSYIQNKQDKGYAHKRFINIKAQTINTTVNEAHNRNCSRRLAKKKKKKWRYHDLVCKKSYHFTSL